MRTVCVFCGSASGHDPVFLHAARKAGEALSKQSLKLVYGGGKVGLMGAVADAALSRGGEVVGVMPRHLVEREISHNGLTELLIVETMHERKTRMSDLADGFLVLPGGAGTLEEAFEQWTWAQIALHAKPIGFLNVDGFFDPLMDMVDGMVKAGFLAPAYRDMLIVENDPDSILERFSAYVPPAGKTYEASGNQAAVSMTQQTTLKIAVAVIMDDSGNMLLVRKRGTESFMQPGGKIEANETVRQSLERELLEELGAETRNAEFLAQLTAPAANEPNHVVEAQVFRVELARSPAISAEIEEMCWHRPGCVEDRKIAPLSAEIFGMMKSGSNA
ncbi:MAG: TIGR00730 family Rossman fold protein [Rhodobacterales bacterium]|nr:MAG: TIGR00730 family Rossman fold protein [Rhodobacterales bacterium]